MPATIGLFANIAVTTGDIAVEVRAFSAMSRSSEKSRLVCTVAVMSIMSRASRPRGPSDLRIAA